MLLERWRHSVFTIRTYRTQAPLCRNPALGDVLDDFHREEEACRRELEQALGALGVPPPGGAARLKAWAHIRAYATALRGDLPVARAGSGRETRSARAYRRLIDLLQEAGADPALLQRLAELTGTAVQRAHVFSEILGKNA